MFYPRRTNASQGETIHLKILAEEVYSLAGLEATVDYNPGKITILEVTSGDIFIKRGSHFLF